MIGAAFVPCRPPTGGRDPPTIQQRNSPPPPPRSQVRNGAPGAAAALERLKQLRAGLLEFIVISVLRPRPDGPNGIVQALLLTLDDDEETVAAWVAARGGGGAAAAAAAAAAAGGGGAGAGASGSAGGAAGAGGAAHGLELLGKPQPPLENQVWVVKQMQLGQEQVRCVSRCRRCRCCCCCCGWCCWADGSCTHIHPTIS